MKDDTKSIDIVFENCDFVVLDKEQNVHASLRVVSEDYIAELYTINQYAYNYFSIHQRASWARIDFNKSALNKKTEFGDLFSDYIKDKDITHIDIKLNDGRNYYIAVPYLPISQKYGFYNLYQREEVYDDTLIITFSKRNLWGNLPKAVWWWIRWAGRRIKYWYDARKAS